MPRTELLLYFVKYRKGVKGVSNDIYPEVILEIWYMMNGKENLQRFLTASTLLNGSLVEEIVRSLWKQKQKNSHDKIKIAK